MIKYILGKFLLKPFSSILKNSGQIISAMLMKLEEIRLTLINLDVKESSEIFDGIKSLREGLQLVLIVINKLLLLSGTITPLSNESLESLNDKLRKEIIG